jgi:hypothetical protein
VSKRNDLNFEEWIREIIEGVFRPALAEIDPKLAEKLPKRIDPDFAFTSGGTKECFGVEVWHAEASSHNVPKMIIRCDAADVETITALAAHGIVHIVVGPDVKHGKPFRDVALPFGLVGPMSKCVPGPRLRRRLNDFLAGMPPCPRGALNYKKFKPSGEERKGASEEAAVSDRPAPQKGRMLKAACLPCDYVMRAAAQTLRRGVPLCPMCGMKMWHEELPEEAGTAQQPEESPEPSDMRPVPGDAQ